VYWCVACGRTFRPESLAGVTDRPGGYVTGRGTGAPAVTLPLPWEDR
jgi:hypothetical protein